MSVVQSFVFFYSVLLAIVTSPLWGRFLFDRSSSAVARWRKRPAVIARKKRRQATRLAKLNERAAPLVEDIRELQEISRKLPIGSDLKAVRRIASDYLSTFHFANNFHLRQTGIFPSPLYSWMNVWFRDSNERGIDLRQIAKRGEPGWDVSDALVIALEAQHAEWQAARDRYSKTLRILQLEIDALSEELGVESRNYLEPDVPRVRIEPPVESKRDKLAKLREDADKLEKELLAEEQGAASGPHRRAAGVAERD